MKRTATFLFSLLMTLAASAQGWPEQYEGVMIQGFWWDSYQESRWTVLTQQADELSQYFQLIWVPNSGKTSDFYHTGRNTMGYDPCFWLDHTSCFGTEDELRTMIKTFKAKGTGLIEDVVVNHKNGLTSWTDFPNETRGNYTITWDNTNFSGICQDDECNSKGYKTTGAKDTGDNFDGYRDLDHTNAQVQQNVKTYLSFLLDDLGYVGFRYDMVKGFSAQYVGQYNTSAQPQFSVGEYWDSNSLSVRTWVNGTKQDGKIQSAAFDFPMKYNINRAFQNGTWSALRNSTLTTTSGSARYSVTFVDNHDTGKNPANTNDGPLGKNVCAANAYILAMPGTPCLWLKHWQLYKGTLKRLIAARHAVGLTNESQIVTAATPSPATGFILKVKGTKGEALLLLGDATAETAGYQLAVEGTSFKYYVSTGVDLSAVQAVTDKDIASEEPSELTIPSFCTVGEGETCAFFEAPANWTNTIYCWAWTNSPSDNFTYANKGWPGVACTYLGIAGNGNKVWKWLWDGTKQNNSSAKQPKQIIFSNNGSPQTGDLDFENGGYYNADGLQANVLAAIKAVTAASGASPVEVFTLGGRLIARYPAGTPVNSALMLLRTGTYIVKGEGKGKVVQVR